MIQNKPAKRFDYNAYMEGRRVGKYVIKYIEEDLPEEVVTESAINILITVEEVLPEETITETAVNSTEPVKEIPDALIYDTEKNTASIISVDTGGNTIADYPELNMLNNSEKFIKCDAIVSGAISFKGLPDINCRGAPFKLLS